VAGNPIDAFPRSEQDLYLDWLAGKQAGTRALTDSVSVVLTSLRGPAQHLMSRDRRFRLAADDGTACLYVRRRPIQRAQSPVRG
jgi:hypothetical protein